nr:reverse transcriptase domain-containing protein [Tanacetum cinerariifolium]
MNKSAEHAQMPSNFAVRNTADKGSKQPTGGNSGSLPEDRLCEICEKHYDQILPIMAEKAHQEKLKGVQTRLSYNESSRQKAHTKEKTQYSESESYDRKRKTKKRRSPARTTCLKAPVSIEARALGVVDKNVFTRMGEKREDVRSRLGPKVTSRPKHTSDRRRTNSEMSAEDQNRERNETRNPGRSYVTCSSKRHREIEEEWDAIDQANRRRLNDNIPKSVDEMMSITIAFFRGEVAVANQSRKKTQPTWKHHETSHKPSFDKRPYFKNRHKSNRRQDRFTPLTKSPKEILAMETVKFKASPLMTGHAENQNKNKFCEFYGDKAHNIDECIHLRKQIEEAVKSGQLSHRIKEIKQGGNKGEHVKTAKKGETSNKEKATAIFMVQPWQRITRVVEETFQTLRRINMKFNPKKCTFGVKEGRFLGYIVNIKGTKACPDKVEAVIKLQAANGNRTQTWGRTDTLPLRSQRSNQCGLANGKRLTAYAGLLQFTYALRFKFKASNNKAKYEALVAGLHIAKQMRVHNLEARVDSRLVASHNGSYVEKEQSMIQYLEKAKMLISGFKKFLIEQVPRNKNKKEDALSKIASTSFAYLTKQVLIDLLKEKSIGESEVLAVVKEEGYS